MKDNLKYIQKVLVLLGSAKTKLPFMISMFLIVSVLDMASIGVIAPFITILISPDVFLESEIYLFLSSYLFFLGPDNLIEVFSYMILVIFLIKTIGVIFINKLIFKFSYLYGVELRKKLMMHYQNQPYSQFLKGNSANYINRMQIAGDFSQNVLQSFLRLVSESVIVLLILLLLVWSSWEALILLIALLGGFVALYSSLFKAKIQAYGHLVNKSLVSMVKVISENFEGFKLIRIFGKNKFFYQKLKESAEVYASANIKNQMLVISPRYLLEFMVIIFVILLTIGLGFFSTSPQEVVVIISVFSVAAIRLIPSTSTLINSINTIRHGKHITDILYNDFINIDKKFKSCFNQQSEYELHKFSSLEFKNVQFSHKDSKKNILNNVSLKINNGDAIGIVGKSGSGKTTLIDLMLGLLDLKQGEIIVNGDPLSKSLNLFWSHVAYLPQQMLITDDSLRNNIAFGQSEQEIDDVKVMQAIESAQLLDLLSHLPNGINSRLGERGAFLSGGQKQRVSLARAFYYNKNILIMDESTSALDSETEHEIVQEVKKLKRFNTIIVVAHRLSTLEYCDSIYEVKNGEVNQI